MADFKTFLNCLMFSPSLYYYFTITSQWEKYQPNTIESVGNTVVSAMNVFKSMGAYSSPLLIWMLYRRGYASQEGAFLIGKVGLTLAVVVATSCVIRALGRASNPVYREFLKHLRAYSKLDVNTLRDIKKYDFDFTYWPVEFEFQRSLASQHGNVTEKGLLSIISSPCSFVGFFVIHSFGIRLMYPGSMTILNALLWETLSSERFKLIQQWGGERFKLKTVDSNYIDSMFVDLRKSKNPRGQYLVICSEGNSGFYEHGIMTTPLGAGFSVLGWNHPGFGSSTGMPYLTQEHNAIDTVMQFAIHDLKFTPDHIILFGWSIGGYSSAYAASRYPSVREVIVDATFDDVLPLAQNQMPDLLEPIVRRTIKCYANLNVADLLVNYQGTIKMIRRTQDEVIAIEPGNVSTNRGNFLLHRLLKHRFPALFNKVSEGALLNWFAMSGSAQTDFVSSLNIKRTKFEKMMSSYVEANGPRFPYTDMGKDLDDEDAARCLIFLAESYMVDFNSTHCTPLPESQFLALTDIS